MKKIAIRMLVVALCLTMGMFAVGCGTDNETPAGDSDVETENVSGTITISLIESNKPGMTPLIEDFEKAYPDIKVEAEFISDLNAYYSQLPTRMAAGNGPDLVYMIPGSASPCGVARFAEAGYLLDLSDQPWVSDMYEPTKPIMMYDDAVVAKDIGFTPLADMLYNKDYFEANNLEIPETFDELVALCKQIRALDDGVTPISWGAGDPAVNHNDVASMSVNTVFSANPDWLQDRKDGKTTFATTEGWRTTLTQLQELIEIGAFSPGAAGVNFSQMSAEFGNGQTAMAFTAGVMAGMA
ncbi:MAG: extracellular solute-binding protein, partial [Clostridiales Family XIII bacterium]|nr:extracellular solute-binding protein [Clostridiales Family XIII bacterium]